MTILEEFGVEDTIPTEYKKSYSNSQSDISIPHNLKDLSTYSKFLAIYTKDTDTNIYNSIEEKQCIDVKRQWDYFTSVLKDITPVQSLLNDNIVEYHLIANIANKFTNNLLLPIKVSEYSKEGENQVRGCITTIENENDFNDWFIYHILDQSRLDLAEKRCLRTEKPYHELFSNYFEKNLKNTIKNDEWDISGNSYFLERVRYFTDRFLRIECVLPAFPCKSSNLDKVAGDIPDKGEELALRRLIKATTDVSNFYPPGMKIWIVSDGHVFSDCIGVDDDVVNRYTAKLHQLYESIANPEVDAIGFCGLNDIFFNGASASKFSPQLVEGMDVEHLTGSKICAISDISRAIMMKGCDTDDGRLRKQISINGHPRLNLYRGFSRFMMEDLALLPNFKGTSKKGFKKTVSKIAFNMIKRNDAYSNLVELIFPHHLRLSIHAHTNSGPKFGIKVISPDQCMIIKSLNSEEEPKFEDLLHIPTPWHNCVAKLGGAFVLTKSKIIKDALEEGTYSGEWQKTCLANGNGGYYILQKNHPSN